MWVDREQLVGVPVTYAHHDAFLWSARGVYREHPAYERWRAGLEYRSALWRWLTPSRIAERAGIAISRAGIVSDPPTQYQRYERAVADVHQCAGEHVAHVDEDRALAMGFPDYDFWLIDARRVITPVYRQHALVGGCLDDGPVFVALHRVWRALIAQHAFTPTVALSA